VFHGCDSMDDTYKINAARTEMREAFSPETRPGCLPFFTRWLHGHVRSQSSRYGSDARLSLAEEAAKCLRPSVRFVPIIIEISVMDAVAFDRGWHEIYPGAGKLAGKRFQALPVLQYVKKVPNGDWKITLQVNNTDVPEQSRGIQKVRGS